MHAENRKKQGNNSRISEDCSVVAFVSLRNGWHLQNSYYKFFAYYRNWLTEARGNILPVRVCPVSPATEEAPPQKHLQDPLTPYSRRETTYIFHPHRVEHYDTIH